ncbi:MAG: lactate utilization protein [Lachnospiraceae bacterium]|nr:lactate utilization protein [Lachnospiraceae bacterium]
MTPKVKAFRNAAEGIIKNLEKRNMEGYYFDDSASCVEAILNMMEEGSVVSWGGSESVKECGLMDAIQGDKYTLIDRMTAKSPEEAREIFAKTVMADYYLMSTNAITMDGELINIDGNGNRLACLIHGPKHIIMVVGMNKLVSTVQEGYDRVRDIATPANTVRLNKNTPCAHIGRCGDCLSPDCICNQVVVTRRSGHPGRIKVFFVAEELGY